MFDHRIKFNLPRKWEYVEGTDEDGEKSYKICYNISKNDDGEKQAEETYSLMKRQKNKSLLSNVEGNYPVQVVGSAKDFNIGLNVNSSTGYSRNSQILFKIFTGVAVVEYEDLFIIVNTFSVGRDDYPSRSEAAEKIAAGLTKVLGFILLEGEALKIKPIPKSLMLIEFKKDGFDLKTIEETLDERKIRLEREKREKEIRLERERKEREEREKAAEEMRRAEEKRRKIEEESARKAAAQAKVKLEIDQKAWEEKASRIKKDREKALEQRLSEIEETRKTKLSMAEEEKTEELYQYEQEGENISALGSKLEKELASLGFFSFSKKNNLKKAILENEDKKTQLAEKKEAILTKYEERISEIMKEADLNAQNAKTVIDKQYPIPESPAERERKRIEKQEAEKKRKEEERARKEYIKNLRGEEAKVYDVLCTYGSMPASMVANEIDLTIQRTSAYLKRLVDAGIVEKTVKNGKVWFDIK